MSKLETNLWRDLKAGDVISLWDIMADTFIKGANLYYFGRVMGSFSETIRYMEDDLLEANDLNEDSMSYPIENCIGICDFFELSMSKVLAERINEKINSSEYPSVDDFKSLEAIIAAEMSKKQFLLIEHGDKWENIHPFGNEVSDKFPESAEDIFEGNRCFCVGRYTACIFHLMRAMEAALQHIALKLGVLNVEKEWGKILSDVDEKIKSMPKDKNKKQWSEIRANLYHVKECWRNETMHPKKTYTQSEAKAVFDAVNVFMNKLASKV